MNFKSIFFAFALLCVAGSTIAQATNDEAAVKEVINRLFKGMQLGDSAMVRSVFVDQVALATIFRDKNNAPRLRQESSIADFVKAVGTPHKEVWYEEIWNTKVLIDGDFAQGWCDYAFYIDNTFSHCGVDAFLMFRGTDGWKIFHLADTRRKTGCNIPKEIQDKHQ